MSHHSKFQHLQPAYSSSNPMLPYSGGIHDSSLSNYKHGYPSSAVVPGASVNPNFAANSHGSLTSSSTTSSASMPYAGSISTRYPPGHYVVPPANNVGYSSAAVIGSSYGGHSIPASPASTSAPTHYMRSMHPDIPPSVYPGNGTVPNSNSYPIASGPVHYPQSGISVNPPHQPPAAGYPAYNQLSTEQIYQLYSMRRSVPMQQQGQSLPAPGPIVTLDGRNQTRGTVAIDAIASKEKNSSLKSQPSMAVEAGKSGVAQNESSSTNTTTGGSPVSPRSTPDNTNNSTGSGGSNRLPPLSSILSNETAQTTAKAPSSSFSHQGVISAAPEPAPSQKSSPSDYIFPPRHAENLELTNSYDRSSASTDSSRIGLTQHGHERSISSPVPTSSALLAKRPIKPKRKRASSFQVSKLNQVFAQTFFPSSELRLSLAIELGMTPRTVQIWFQNKRQGWRSEHNCSVPRDTSMKPLKLSDVFPEKSGTYCEHTSIHHHQHQPHYDHSNSLICSNTSHGNQLIQPANAPSYPISQDLSRSAVALPSLSQQNQHQTHHHSTSYQILALPAPRHS